MKTSQADTEKKLTEALQRSDALANELDGRNADLKARISEYETATAVGAFVGVV